MNKQPVKIFWYLPEERGRKLPPGPSYYGVIRTCGPAEDLNEEWSVHLEMNSVSDHPHVRNGMMSFVSKNAPAGSLEPGRSFYLFEGRWPVAEGVVLRRLEG